MKRTLKILTVLIGLSNSTTLTASMILEGMVEQEKCNKSGFYYDHDKHRCTDLKVIECDDSTIAKFISDEKEKKNEWAKIKSQLKKSGYAYNQCVQKRDDQITVNFVKQGLFVEYKTVKIAH